MEQFGLRIENKENNFWRIGDFKALLKRFSEFCLVDLQLSRGTVTQHRYNLKKLFNWLKDKGYKIVTVDVLREFLMEFRFGNPYTYSNLIKSLKRFFRDFLGIPELVRSFKFPSCSLALKRIPTKIEIKRFYEALNSLREKAIFLLMASSGLRRSEALNIRLQDIDFERRMILPNHDSKTKRSYITFYNNEAEEVLKQWLKIRPKNSERLFPIKTNEKHRIFTKAIQKTGLKITPQILREWFACEMGRLGVPDRYVDALCGRVPRTVLARHYTDFSPEKLKEIYDKADLKVLS